ncbi:MAG: 16S rRNA (guanine(966)-N(2))-methyltransferase RsmD [Oscillospiraceae bacterium]|jgi:16S rRNA (guanine(966)-N(2))-methyltransferase RsmD|nr:16S rRNA (guanine(966)-N(2))-methyltransferase RsmD [Oscillospiraceae bacterium]
MRIITGSARGAALFTVPGPDVVRPTTQRVKEAMFSAVQFEIAGRRALDAFAGSGQLGIEALSRGAASCVFLDRDPAALEAVRKNLEKTRLAGCAKVRQADALAFLRDSSRQNRDSFGLIFLDPPYGSDLLKQTLPLASACLTPGGLLLCEAPAQAALPETIGDVALRRAYRHGKTCVFVFQRAEADGNGEHA